MILIKIMIFFY